MKIPASIRTTYEAQRDVYEALKERADQLIRSRLRPSWHYESRVKAAESFTLKIESGRVSDPGRLEDFFASTIVVKNSSEIAAGEKIVQELFDLQYRRPEKDQRTHKPPEEFSFDDLRMYVQWKDDKASRPTQFNGILFEVQIKTFLQHAWSIATHDLIYKTDDVSWSKRRIAFQIKAMLEHAEISIQEASRLADCESLAKEDWPTFHTKQVIKLLTDVWQKEDLPEDIRRLADNIARLTKELKVSTEDLGQQLLKEQDLGRGPLTRNLSPYGVVLQTLFLHSSESMRTLLTDGKKKKFKVLLPAEVELPTDLRKEECVNAIFV